MRNWNGVELVRDYTPACVFGTHSKATSDVHLNGMQISLYHASRPNDRWCKTEMTRSCTLRLLLRHS